VNAPAVGLRIQPRDAARAQPRVLIPPLALRAIAFWMLSAFAAAHWTALLDPAPLWRGLLLALVATVAGVGIALTADVPRPAGTALRILIVLGLLVLSLAAIGIRIKLLWPTRWDTLADRISGGLNAAGSVTQWPYDGPNRWLRLTALLGASLSLTAAAGLAFWPRRRGRGDGAVGLGVVPLVLLVSLYGVAVAARPFDADGLRGLGLLAGIAAWLWLPRLRGREAAAAVTAVVATGLLGLFLMGPVAASEPWVEYRQWSWTLPKEKTIAFDWTHRYGPLDWPRKGTTLLLVKAAEAHYWKAENLEEFDGRRWTTGRGVAGNPALGSAIPQPSRRPWNETIEFTVRGLSSGVVVGAGTVYDITKGDLGATVPLADGVHMLDRRLGAGDTYSVRAYVPDPSAREMRRAPGPSMSMQGYTTLRLPGPRTIQPPLRSTLPAGADPGIARWIDGSPYRRVYALANRIAAGAATDYDVVKRINAYLEKNYAYSEDVPSHLYPLTSFLFQDRRGYCQQFSGAAALMLRLLGIPTRVASGFAPGTFSNDTREYVVQDLDAHSWIEVWFEGIGWVPFDPTPALAPAQSQSVAAVAPSAARGDARDRIPRKSLDRLLGTRPDSSVTLPSSGSGGGLPWGPILLALSAGALMGSALSVWWRTRRRRNLRPRPRPCGDADVDQLVTLMSRLGLDVDARTTLYELERRLDKLGGPEAADYARRLRERRFADADAACPGRAERRRLRRVLAGGVGASRLARLRLALPDNPFERAR
jgi:hypothetical protein